MNIEREKSAERERLAFDLFKNGAKAKDVQDTLLEGYGFKMNLAKLYKIRKAALESAKKDDLQ